jgi:hypothetical protein
MLTPTSLTAPLPASLHEFAVRRQAARRQARNADGESQGPLRRFRACADSFLKALDATPRPAILHYKQARREMKAEADRLLPCGSSSLTESGAND